MVAFIPSFKVVKYYYNKSGISQMKELVFYYMYKHILKSNWGVKISGRKNFKVLKFFTPAFVP